VRSPGFLPPLAALLLGACSSSSVVSQATLPLGTTSIAPSTTAPAATTTPPVSSSSATTLGTGVPTTPGPTTTAPTTVTPAATPSPTTPASSRCHTSELGAALGPQDHGAGQIDEPLIVRNIGSRTCQILGYPGVSLLDAAGAQIGAPASREGVPPASVTLPPGGSAAALLHTTNGPIGGPCQAPSAQVRVYPPDEYDAIVFPAVFTACGGFTVRPFVAGVSGV
jgi:hypothetical protein